MKNPIKSGEGFIDVNAARLYYKTMGQGDPVVIVHGGPGFDHLHLLSMSKLAKDFKVVFYDQRATGYSGGEVDANSITLDNFVEDLEGLRQQLNLGKMNVIGHSWGGGLAMFYGLKYAHNLKSLILMASAASTEYFGRYVMNIQHNTLPEDNLAMNQLARSEAFKGKDPDAFQKYFRIVLKPYFYDPSAADCPDLTFTENTIKNQAEVGDLLRISLGNYDIHGGLAAIKCPTLIIHAEADPLPVEASYKVHKHIRGSKFVILEKAGHFMFIEAPEKLCAVVRDFIRDDKSVTTTIPAETEERLKSEFF